MTLMVVLFIGLAALAAVWLWPDRRPPTSPLAADVHRWQPDHYDESRS
jgi:hypothetical protein